MKLVDQDGNKAKLQLAQFNLAIFDLDDTLSSSNIEKPVITARLKQLFQKKPKLTKEAFTEMMLPKSFITLINTELDGPQIPDFDTLYNTYSTNNEDNFISAFYEFDKEVMALNKALKHKFEEKQSVDFGLNQFSPLMRSKVFQGMTPLQLKQLAKETYTTTEVAANSEISALLQQISDQIITVVSTGSNHHIAEAWCQYHNIPARVQGSEYCTADNKFTGECHRPNVYQNKIPPNTSQPNILAVGDQISPPFTNDALFRHTAENGGTVIIFGKKSPKTYTPDNYYILDSTPLQASSPDPQA